MQEPRGRGVYILLIIDMALDEDEWSASRPAALYPRVWADITHWIGGWVGLRADLDTEARENTLLSLPEIEPLSSFM
jgi:hypothetical protein